MNQLAEQVEIRNLPEDRRVDVLIDGVLFTAYIYPEGIAKPVLFPIITQSGKPLTRGFPLEQKAGERVDHPHHVGHWLNYGNVNGLDFWNNSGSPAPEKRDKYGWIHHRSIDKIESDGSKGVLAVTMEWRTAEDEVLLEENTQFIFESKGQTRLITRITKLTAKSQNVSFKDNKEGMIAVRVARALELPTDSPVLLTDETGQPRKEKVIDNTGVSGDYLSSKGLKGNDVWGTRATWVLLHGQIDGENVAVAILDHPNNVGYPTYWHARGYGLFSANPLGQAVFSKGKAKLDFALKPRESVTFKYRLLVHSGSALNEAELEAFANTFAKQ